ncbi:MAG: DUF3794 domain-containing protein [Firmicutes bacterium]|nr:DUF3794 domain-containing protein [Bacillota bacterium]
MSTRVVAEAQAQVLVDDTVELFTPAEKIDEIRAVVEDLRCHIIPGKVIFQGILHKQIFFVNKRNTVVHQRVDIPFSGFVDINGAQPGQGCQLIPEIVFLDFQLIAPDRLREKVVIDLTIRLFNSPPFGIIIPDGPQSNVSFRGNPQAFIVRGGAKQGSSRITG